MQVATLEAAARQMSAYAQSNRLKQLASLIVARTSPAEVRCPSADAVSQILNPCTCWPRNLDREPPRQEVEDTMRTDASACVPMNACCMTSWLQCLYCVQLVQSAMRATRKLALCCDTPCPVG